MSTATLVHDLSTSSKRLLADVLEPRREPIVDRLASALGQEFADRLVAALSQDALDRLDAALTREFADRLAALAREAA
jgi:glycosyltransferase A (GT-A) superfamily protein (DUF2064 family)